MGGIIWVIIVGFIAGIIARFLSPGPNNPSGFILTTVLGIAGAFSRDLHRPGDRPLRS
ncbi:putative membrane protein YeaQ/YmgE (transglycosylase-associated protein family) [Bradyrhizobium elkanii]